MYVYLVSLKEIREKNDLARWSDDLCICTCSHFPVSPVSHTYLVCQS